MATLVSGARSEGRQSKRLIDNVKDDLHQRGSDVSQVVECVKEVCPCSAIVGNRPVTEEEEDCVIFEVDIFVTKTLLVYANW